LAGWIAVPESVIFIGYCGWLIWSSHAGLHESPVISVTHGIGFHP
jgi:hypothetical protein